MSSLNDLFFQCFVKSTPPGTALQVTAKPRGSAALTVSSGNDQLVQAIVPSTTTNGQALQVVQVSNSGARPAGSINDLWNMAFVSTNGGLPALQVTTGTFVGAFTGELNESMVKAFVAGPTGAALQVVSTSAGSVAVTGSFNDVQLQSMVDAGGGTTAMKVVFV